MGYHRKLFFNYHQIPFLSVLLSKGSLMHRQTTYLTVSGTGFMAAKIMSCLMTKPTKWHVCPVKTQISLGIAPSLNMLFSHLMYIKNINYGPVKTFVKPLFIFWIIFSLDLELKFIDKLQVFRWELTVPFLLRTCFYFVMKEISWSLSHRKIRLTLLRLSIPLLDTLMIY